MPITVVRGGLRLSSMFPGLLGKKKIQLDNGTELDLSKIHYADLEAMIKDIGELTVDVRRRRAGADPLRVSRVARDAQAAMSTVPFDDARIAPGQPL